MHLCRMLMALPRCISYQYIPHRGKNKPSIVVLEERMRKWQMYNVSRHNVNTTWKKYLQHFCTYQEIDLRVGCKQSWWMKGRCLIWSRGRHFSPSLPDRGPTGIRNLAHSISDPRAEISEILVMVRRSSATSRGTTQWFQFFFLIFVCPRYFVCLCESFQKLSSRKK